MLLASLAFVGCFDGKMTETRSADANDSTATERYAELLREGERSLAAGRLVEARTAFEGAAAELLIEVPNYEVLTRIAEVRCREGDWRSGLSLVADFRCMLEVDAGRRTCFIRVAGEEDGQPNPELPIECFERMCSEMYLSYYDHPTEARLKRIEALARDANRVEAICLDMARRNP